MSVIACVLTVCVLSVCAYYRCVNVVSGCALIVQDSLFVSDICVGECEVFVSVVFVCVLA